MPRRALFLVNRKARSGQHELQPIRERLTAGGLELIEPPGDLGDPTALIRQQGRDVELIVLGGGDGTINRALPGLLEVQRPFGVLPLGTANDLARTLELPTDPLAACDVILAGRTQPIDVGRINDRPFVNVASIGLAVDVTRRLTRGAKSRWGVLAYLWAAIGALIRGRPFRVEICCDGECLKTRTWQVAVGNGRSYGGGLTIHEDARIDDGLLDLYSLEVEQGWHILMMIPALWRGSLDPVPTVRTLRGRKIEVRPLGRPRSITADGELVGQTPAVFQLEPAALSVFVPAAIAQVSG
ncbi:MAG: lipid kinase [Planctomycetaceae bacterium]|nr:lipid kinase [Planctomycetaceae bacterium]